MKNIMISMLGVLMLIVSSAASAATSVCQLDNSGHCFKASGESSFFNAPRVRIRAASNFVGGEKFTLVCTASKITGEPNFMVEVPQGITHEIDGLKISFIREDAPKTNSNYIGQVTSTPGATFDLDCVQRHYF